MALDPSSSTEPRIPPTPGGGYELTVVIPSFNERGNVKPLLERLDIALAGVAWQAIYLSLLFSPLPAILLATTLSMEPLISHRLLLTQRLALRV